MIYLMFRGKQVYSSLYYGPNYLKPWVSLTREELGSVDSFVGEYEYEGVTSSVTFYYCYPYSEGYYKEWMWSPNRLEHTITAVGTELTEWDETYPTITINGEVFHYDYTIKPGYDSYTEEDRLIFWYNNETSLGPILTRGAEVPSVGDKAYSWADGAGAIQSEEKGPSEIASGDVISFYFSDFEESINVTILTANRLSSKVINKISYNKPLTEVPLTFEILSAGTIVTSEDLEYSVDKGGTWTPLGYGTELSVNAGDEVQFRGKYGTQFTGSTASFNLRGNMVSLYLGDKHPYSMGIDGVSYSNAFAGTNVVDASKLIIGGVGYSYWCSQMFSGCTSLIAAPALPATTLANNCYEYMFMGCTSLTTAPALPATTVAPYCYEYMFMGCTSLTTAPALPATTLAESCYSGMFMGCTGLTTTPELPATTLASSCYQSMFSNCTSLTTAPQLPVTTLAQGCYSTMFAGCTSLTTAPILPATGLTKECYRAMFSGCTNLNYIKAMFKTTPGYGYYYNQTLGWVAGVASSGTFVKNSTATWNVTGNDGIPNGWTVETADS